MSVVWSWPKKRSAPRWGPGHVCAGLGDDHISSQMADPGDGADQIPETLKGFDHHLEPLDLATPFAGDRGPGPGQLT